MEQSAITDYVFPKGNELIWPVTHVPGCQLQHTIPDTTPRRAQLAAACPALCCRRSFPRMRGGGRGPGADCPLDKELFVALLKVQGAHTHACLHRSTCYSKTLAWATQ